MNEFTTRIGIMKDYNMTVCVCLGNDQSITCVL